MDAVFGVDMARACRPSGPGVNHREPSAVGLSSREILVGRVRVHDPPCTHGCMLNVMDLLASLIVIAALPGAGPPEVAPADEPAELIERVTALHSSENYAGAAKLADDSARREDLPAATRVLLGGLAQQNYGLSFKPGGLPEPLCKQAAILRHVAPLDTAANGAAKIKAAEAVENQLATMLGPMWPAACAPPADAPVDEGDEAAAATSTAVNAASTSTPPAPDTRPAPAPADPHDRRRMRAGVGTIVPGLLMLAPMVGLLVYRAAGERDLAALNLDTATRTPTAADDAKAEALRQRYAATTAGAVTFGITGSVLVVTGAVLLATGTRHRRVAVVPWGARGLGGLVLQGRF